MKKFWRRLRAQGERGAVMFLVAGTTVVVLLMGAMAVDLSSIAARGQSMQNAADSAALAGVQAYRASGGNEQAARQAVEDLLAQNGIELGDSVSVDIEFPDANNTEVKVTLVEDEPDLFLAGVTGVVSEVERSATAKFESCDDTCFKEVVIPAPFRSVDATGDGDGYKPIPVGDNLYALNHNAETLQIVCIDRATEDHCWQNGAGKNAYPSGYQPPRNPEMPHAAVIGTKIYWSVTAATGHRLYCFETTTDTPCSQPFLINGRPRASHLTSRLENRGGGTVAVDDLIYVFTDDHRIHCIVPGITMTRCAGYGNGGLQTGLGAAGFPVADGQNDNHGSSIDRIVDNGRIYSTLHIDNGGVQCDNGDPNMANPEGIVVLKNAATGLYLSIHPSWGYTVDGAPDANGPPDDFARWRVIQMNNGSYVFKSVAAENAGQSWILDADGNYAELDTINRTFASADHRWFVTYQGSTSRIRNEYYDWNGGGYIRDENSNWRTGAYQNQFADWVIRPWECEDPSYGSGGGVVFQAGTWVHCFDTINQQPCANFVPAKLHQDSDSFSGRLFFYRSSGTTPTILGLCSTGFTEQWSWTDMRGLTELTCIDHITGADADSLESTMSSFYSALDGVAHEPWGTWGDPHYNPETNRMFYPTQRSRSRVLCWDFDTGFCGNMEGVSAQHGAIQDYGFFSEGNCVYGLGHNAVFWAFRASDIYEECTGSSTKTTINPCNCSGSLYWGTLLFDVDLALFDSFLIEVYNKNGVRILPAENAVDDQGNLKQGHSLHSDGLSLDLNTLPVNGFDDELTIEVRVDSQNSDPWSQGDQTFTIEFERTPRLTD